MWGFRTFYNSQMAHSSLDVNLLIRRFTLVLYKVDSTGSQTLITDSPSNNHSTFSGPTKLLIVGLVKWWRLDDNLDLKVN